MSFKQILDDYRKNAFSEHDKGARFERLMQRYLLTDPKYAYMFSNVWLWNEFPGKSDLGGSDTGIDLVAKTHEGDYWAIQCKFYKEGTIIDKPAVDSFLSTSSREFLNENMQTTRFAQRLWIDTTGRKWGVNAEEAIRNQVPPVARLNLFELREAPVDWEKLERGIHGEQSRTAKKTLRDHQKKALEMAHEHFKANDRGKLIMACGTGKTFNALRIAEHETNGQGLILFLVPSIALLGQTLRAWSADANEPINAICICSDPEISRKKTKSDDADTFSVVDLAMPASTDSTFILRQFNTLKKNGHNGMTVVFSTYQSIEVISQTQKKLLDAGFNEFDMIICDEAHRTTGITLANEDESAFTKVHDNSFIKANKRLYMTATPRLYSDDSKSKAAQADAVLCSMDDINIYGEEFYRIGFGEAVERDLLTDYKVIILTLSDKDVPPAVQRMISDNETEIPADDLSKLIGCINALSKQFIGDDGNTIQADPLPMKSAVAFCSNIAASKSISSTLNRATEVYLSSLPEDRKEQMVSVSSQHIDGTMSAPERDRMLSWLRESGDGNECKILTNVRVLSEGIDVPSLDAVMFLSARNSQVDVVQSVGRVMRKSDGKKYGYIIIPVIVPADVEGEKALDDNERYKVVWTVLNALRAHDDRFNATVNKIELNKRRPHKILVVGTKDSFDGDGKPTTKDPNSTKQIDAQLTLQFEQLQNVVFAKMVQKVGDRRYWEQWAKDVAIIASRQIERIKFLVSERKTEREAFNKFLSGLQLNINPSIGEDQAIEMLAQHIITKPIFEALFEDYSFAKNNAVSASMQHMLEVLHGEIVTEDSETLQKFYDSVRKRAEGIDNADGKQRIIIELYDKFFKAAFPKMVEQLGIVYTPIEVVDFIIYSINDILKQEFGLSITDELVHLLDPFTGTGTFITRLIQSGLIELKDLERKYKYELHANEIVLLAYYIAAVNIENAYHDATPDPTDGKGDNYTPFDGIVLTDTFQMGETDESQKLFSEMFPKNSERVDNQRRAPVRVIFGNPPYSVGQKSANDNAQNQKYEKLDSRISQTYAKLTDATNKNALYDSYIKAFRWSTDRLNSENGGIIAFVSNGGWIDGNSTEGFRMSLEKEFSSIWIFNTRGNARTQGELRRKEAGNIFGGGSRTPITITILVKNPKAINEKAIIRYYDIGDYLSREEKLKAIKKLSSVRNIEWTHLLPNEHGDWISQRNDIFETFIPFDEKGNNNSIWNNGIYCRGLETSRDSWLYNSNIHVLEDNLENSIKFFNEELEKFKEAKLKSTKTIEAKDIITFDSLRISWSRAFINDIINERRKSYNSKLIVDALYRPFFKQHLYFSREQNNVVSRMDSFFPNQSLENLVICVSANYKDGTVLVANIIPDLHFNGDTQVFPLYFYEERAKSSPTLFDNPSEHEYIRRDGISDFILQRAQKQYGKNVTKEDIFYYVYGFLHSHEYRTTFANDLKKMLPRIPLVDDVRDFWKFSKAGRQLAELHLGYEKVPAYSEVQVTGIESGFFTIEKMRFPKKDQKDTIVYNSRITISNIPEKAYEYVVNGKSAIEWIMERYRVTVDKVSGIKNDPNDWANEVGNPRYILNLLLSIINVSVQTVDIVESLPKLKFD